MSALPIEGIPMRHVKGPDGAPGTSATCEAVSAAQADYLQTLGWERIVVEGEPEPVMVPDTANGLEADTAVLEELAELDPDTLAALAELAGVLEDPTADADPGVPAPKPNPRDSAPSRRTTSEED